jgi:hypothetical protein
MDWETLFERTTRAEPEVTVEEIREELAAERER